MAEEKEMYDTIDYQNKTKSVPKPDNLKNIDTDKDFFDYIIESADTGKLDSASISSLTNVSRSRDTLYDMLDNMAQDSMISGILDIYCQDACEPNSNGKIVWCESNDEKVKGMVDYLLDTMKIDKNTYGWVYHLIKYGDLYLRLYRESEYDDGIFNKSKNKPEDKEVLNEAINLQYYSKNDRYAEYMEIQRNPAEMFDLQKFGKTAGYIRAHINHQDNINNSMLFSNSNNFIFNFNTNDIDIYDATEFVHASLEDNTSRTEEEVTISNDKDHTTSTYKVKRGQSLLYDSYKVWKELSLLENAVLLNRLTRSSIVRTVQVDITDMSRDEIRKTLQKIKSMIEQKAALSVGNSIHEYTNPGSMDNVIYIPTREGHGGITVGNIGGDSTDQGNLVDLDHWVSRLAGSFGIPKQFIGNTDDSGGFDGGTSLSLLSSRYAKGVKRIQNAYIQCITDAINLMLYDRGLVNYINKFTLRMQAPATKEEKDRRETLSSDINNIRDIVSLFDLIENPITKLKITKSLLGNSLANTEVLSYIQEEIDIMEEAKRKEEEESASSENLNNESPTEEGNEELDFDNENTESESSEEDDFGGELDFSDAKEESGPDELPSMPEEDFNSNKGNELLVEDNDDNLPSFEELNINYNDIYNK